MENKISWEEDWEKFLPSVVGHGTGIIGDVRPFIRQVLASQKEKMLGVLEGMKNDYGSVAGYYAGYNKAIDDIKKKITDL